VTTDSQGQAVFDIPFSLPAALPILTATATDPNGNTSELTAVRPATAEAPVKAFRFAPGESLSFSNASGNAFAIQDPDLGPLEPAWEIAVSVASGTLALSSTAGLEGAGDGTGSLSYTGALSAVNAALEGMTYTPPPGYQGTPTLSFSAQSLGASPIQAHVELVVTGGRLEVTTVADSGPGSLRQAILDSNAAIGGSNTIDFTIPGQGAHTIDLASPLPPIDNTVLIDGTSQPGYEGAPLIEIAQANPASPAGLTITESNLTVSGLGLGRMNSPWGPLRPRLA
jgi:hypothetical protein